MILILQHPGSMDRLSIRVPEGSTPGSQLFHGAMPIFFRRSFRTGPVLPEFISERGDVLLGGLPVLLLAVHVSFIRMLEAVSGVFMPGRVIFLPVVLGAGPMRVGSHVVVLGGYLL
jgi:hypothetical protein